jgi:hypothetical protein
MGRRKNQSMAQKQTSETKRDEERREIEKWRRTIDGSGGTGKTAGPYRGQ